jgi:hypothetical protein
MDLEETPKGRHSLGIVIPPKRKDITVVVQGGLLPQDFVDASGDTSSEASGGTTSRVLGETNDVSDEVSGRDVCDGEKGHKVESNDGNDRCKGSNEENITQK